jgi:aerobic-type carbon monoxide dehydrogenase small subunit (CoxS/CutS family)
MIGGMSPRREARGAFADPHAELTVELTLNGAPASFSAPARWTLADALREKLGATGTHLGCEHGVCGACTVLLDGEAVRACLLLAVQADGRAVDTVEGLADGDELAPLQRAFHEHHALQCGFCTPGFLMLAEGFLTERPDATKEEIREVVASNLCRCTGYQTIVEAVDACAARRREGSCA